MYMEYRYIISSLFTHLFIHLNSSETIARCWYILLSGSVLMKDSMVLPPCRYVYIGRLVYLIDKVYKCFISYVKLFYVEYVVSLSR